MKYLFYLLALLLFSCSSQKQGEETSDQSVVKNSFGAITIESVIEGKDSKDFFANGLHRIEYNVFRSDSLLTTVEITHRDFSEMYNRNFSERSLLWESTLISVDEQSGLFMFKVRFGPAEADNQTNVIVVSDFKGNKKFRDSPLKCTSGTNLSFNRIVDCKGVYDFDKPIIEFKDCCTVFSDLINDSTLFYVRDGSRAQRKNAFLINIYSKDTLDSFVYRDFEEGVHYTALISLNKETGILAVLQIEEKNLFIWDAELKKGSYDLSEVKSVPDLIPIGNFIEMYHEDLGQITIELNEKNAPTRWNK